MEDIVILGIGVKKSSTIAEKFFGSDIHDPYKDVLIRWSSFWASKTWSFKPDRWLLGEKYGQLKQRPVARWGTLPPNGGC